MILDLKPSIKQPKGFWIQGWHSWYITNRPAHIHWLCEYLSNYMPTLIWFQRNIRYLSPTKWNIKLMLISVGSPCINYKYCSIVKTSISMVSESESLYLNLCLKYKYHNLWYVFAVFWFNFCCFIFSVHNHGPMSLNHWNLISPFHWLNPSSMPCLELVLRHFRGHPCSAV